MAAQKLVGFGVDGDEFAVAPGAGVMLVGYCEAVDGVAHGFELLRDVDRELLFEVDAVGQVLVMKARCVGSLLDVEAVVYRADDVVRDGGDDGRAAGGSHDVGELPVFVPVAGCRDDGRRHRGEWTLAGTDGVGGALDEAVDVGDADLGGEVVHLIVHEEAEAFDSDSGAEAAVEGSGGGDGRALSVDDGVVGGLGGFFCRRLLRGRWHEANGTDEVFAGRRFGGVDGASPRCRVLQVRHLFDREGVEVGVAEVVSAILVSATEGFGDDVDLCGAAVWAEFWKIVGGEDVEDLDKDDAAGGGWRCGDEIEAVVLAADGDALFDLIGGEVFSGDKAAACFFEVGDLVGHRAFIELVGVLRDAGEGRG